MPPLRRVVQRDQDFVLHPPVDVLNRVPVRQLPRRLRVRLVLAAEGDLDARLLQQRLHLGHGFRIDVKERKK